MRERRGSASEKTKINKMDEQEKRENKKLFIYFLFKAFIHEKTYVHKYKQSYTHSSIYSFIV